MSYKEMEKSVFKETGVKISIKVDSNDDINIRIGHKLIEVFESYNEVLAFCIGMVTLSNINAN